MLARCLAIGLVISVSQIAAGEDAKSPLEGEWMWLTTHIGTNQNEKLPVIRGNLKFDGNKVTMTYGKSGSGSFDKMATGTYIYDGSSKPARIMLQDLPSEIPTTVIVKIEGDKLTTCYHTQNGDVPDKFETKQGDHREMGEYQRLKKSN